MPELKKDKKELSTNRLLEAIRGETIEDTDRVGEEQLGLSEEEQAALTGQTHVVDADFAHRAATAEKSSHFDAIRGKALNLIKRQKGIIGIDIGADSVKYVYFIREKNNYILKDMGIRKVEEHYTGDPRKKEENIKKAVNELVSVDAKKSSAVAVTLPGPNVAIKKITLPNLPKKEIKDAVIWNAKKDLPFSGDDALFDYKILGKIDEKGIEKLEILVAIVENKLIHEQIRFYGSLSIEPVKILPIPLAIYSNFLQFTGDHENASGVVIDIGAKLSHIIFIHDGHLQFAREVSTGGDDISEGMMGALSGSDGVVKIDKEEAERLKFVYGIPPDDAVNTTEHGISLNQIASVMRPTLERLLVQIQRSFDYYRTKFPFEEPDKVYITGGTALLKNFVGFLSEGLGKEIEVLNPLKNIIVEPELEEEKSVSEVAPSLAVAIGSVFSDDKGVNLLPHEIKEKLLFAVQSRILKIAAVFIVLIMTLWSFSVRSELSSVKKEKTEAQEDRIPFDVLEGQYDLLTNQKDEINRTEDSEKEKFDVFSGSEEIQVLNYLKLLSGLKVDYMSLEQVSLELNSSNEMNLIGRIDLDKIGKEKSEAEFYILDYLTKLEDSGGGMFLQVNPYEIVEPDEVSIDPATVSESSVLFKITCSIPQTVSYN